MLRQTIQQKLQQRLSPAQIQVIKMLELPTLELEERIRQELEENPALEEGQDQDTQDDVREDDLNDDGGNNDDMDLEEYMPDDDIPDFRLKTNNYSKDDKHEEIPFSVGKTFHETLNEQLGFQILSDHEHKVAAYIIGNIDEEGYLRRPVESLVDDIVFYAGIHTSDEEVARLVTVIQSFDPPGIGASSLQECLKLQLERKPQNEQTDLALMIINKYFEEFSKRHYDKIRKLLDIDNETLKDVVDEISRLNPKPGNAWGGTLMEKSMTVIVPDFILEEANGQLTVHLNNSNVPELRVNKVYSNLFEEYQHHKTEKTQQLKDAVVFAKQKVDSARWFIDAIKQRHETLLTTMQAIVDYQKEYFLEGDDTFLKPMILKDIADITDYDISTISRVSNSKYIQTNFGIFPVKYFFSESMTNEDGEEVSTREIKKIMMDCVDNEDKRKPMNDEELAEALKDKGYPIARRTVAKYREQLNIPVARLRKEL